MRTGRRRRAAGAVPVPVKAVLRWISCGGRSPPQVPNVLFLEDCYLITDPFDASRQRSAGLPLLGVQFRSLRLAELFNLLHRPLLRLCVELTRSKFPAEVQRARWRDHSWTSIAAELCSVWPCHSWHETRRHGSLRCILPEANF